MKKSWDPFCFLVGDLVALALVVVLITLMVVFALETWSGHSLMYHLARLA